MGHSCRFGIGHESAHPHIADILGARRIRRDVPQAAVSNRSKQQCYSITSSAVASSVVGMERPSALAVFRLITNSNLVGRSIGRSAALVPPKILDTYGAARRNMCRRSGP